MKLNQRLLGLPLTALATTTIAGTLACAIGIAGCQTGNTAIVDQVVAQAHTTRAMSGKFIAAEKPTTGTARIVEENGHRFLELDSAFSTSDQGPDLHVLLDTTGKPPQKYDASNSGRYINLGKLSKYAGTQRYPIPDAVNVANYRSVVIWCRMANATFGYAPLGGTRNAAAPK
jgi:hypothetical protein